jgi:hypothetical protein
VRAMDVASLSPRNWLASKRRDGPKFPSFLLNCLQPYPKVCGQAWQPG